MPVLRPFRALRYDASRVDPSAVICPPYDVISESDRAALLERSPYNAVRIELPVDPDPDDPQSRYMAAARTLLEWRTGGILRKDRRPAVYIHEQRYRVPGEDGERVARGVLARLHLEPFVAGTGVRAHEHTMPGPREDRFRLLKATGMNVSPVALIHEKDEALDDLERLTARDSDVEATNSAGTSHRLWVIPAEEEGELAGAAEELCEVIGSGPITMADGHHRYVTALTYQEERGRTRACESDPPFDYVFALVYHVDESPVCLATHRTILGLPSDLDLLSEAARLFDVERVEGADDLVARMAPSLTSETSTGRLGLWTRNCGAVLTARPKAFPGVFAGGDEPPPDVVVLHEALRELAGIGPDELAAGDRVRYTRDPRDAIASVDAGRADAAVLLDPTPIPQMMRVAAAGGVMPQKSTYFHPKAPTGLLFNPLEP